MQSKTTFVDRNIKQILWRNYQNQKESSVRETENLKFKYASATSKKKKTEQKKISTYKQKKKETTGGLFSAVINNIAKEKINQIISQGGKEVERVLPKALRGAIEDVCQTPFRLLGNFSKN